MIEVQSKRVGNYLVRVVVDECPFDPRDGDGYANFVAYHPSYNLPNDVDLPRGYLEELTLGEIGQMLRNEYGAYLMLPVSLHEYSGGAYVPNPELDPDSEQVGFIFATEAQIREWHMLNPDKPISPFTEGLVLDGLRAEVDEYSEWAQGNVYGFVIETATTTYKVKVNDRDEGRIKKVKPGYVVDSCWGFVGDADYCMTEGIASVPES